MAKESGNDPELENTGQARDVFVNDALVQLTENMLKRRIASNVESAWFLSSKEIDFTVEQLIIQNVHLSLF